ncbi:hypothetical protein [Haladaptatus sp. DYF46]|uniref:hypothetical protein n=1 Tax=Haladaptatus sp. DYF46 TaxID=2886041 RepID=UPI001E3302F1|nr:hypothetical protein [Haladaptatus sp. DYF46]
MPVAKVKIAKQSQKWRYRCPNGHTTWEPTNNHLWCRACARQLDVDPEFWELYDSKTHEAIPRERLVLDV